MSDVVVTVPLRFEYEGQRGLAAWIAEGDPAGTRWSGQEWAFWLGSIRPDIKFGERVYVVYNGRLRGYAPLVRLHHRPAYDSGPDNFYFGKSPQRYALIRGGGATAMTIDEPIKGFRGFRYRWWRREDEKPFPDWMIP